LKLKNTKRPSPFYLGYFSLSKKFNYVGKGASILQLKSGSNNMPSYFPISTPLGHPPSSQLTYYEPLVVEMESF
jgi:hypothetical protein